MDKSFCLIFHNLFLNADMGNHLHTQATTGVFYTVRLQMGLMQQAPVFSSLTGWKRRPPLVCGKTGRRP